MTKHSFRLQDVTGDARILARSAYGYDWNYFTDDEVVIFGTGDDGQLLWSTADASNNALVLALGDTNQSLHITDVEAKSTDWDVSAETNPTLYIHSNTTPATDYLAIGRHDGTTGYIDMVGGTTLAMQISGSTVASITSTSVTVNGSLTSSASIRGVGYSTGAGGTITQQTGKSTGVTLNKATGQITMNGEALAASTTISFTLTCSAIAATDIVLLNHISGGTAGAYTLNAQAGSGSALINVRNVTSGGLSEAIVIAFAVVKAVTS